MIDNLIWVKCKSNDYYKIIKKIEPLRINIYEIKYEKKFLYLKINEKDYEKITKYIVSYKFEKVSNSGIKKIWDKIKQEKIFVIAAFLGIIVFFVLSNLVYEINIIHENKEIREIIKEELDEYGVKVLSWKKDYNELNKIRNKILDKYPDKLDWMEFDVNGMVVNVRVEERIITDTKKEEKACHLVATKAGVVSDIAVYDGESLVMINDYVKKGDTLVSGEIKLEDNTKRVTCAKGEVYATTWYTVNVSVPFNYIDYVKTGESRYNIVWEINENKKEIFRSRFEKHESKLKTILSIFDFKVYLEKEMEIEKINGVYNENEALNVGIEKAVASIEEKISDKDTIIEKKVLQKRINDSKMDIDVFIVVNELISTEEEFVVGEGND